MAKKKVYDSEDPDTWTDAQMNKYIIDSVKDIGMNLPWDKIALSAVFIYGHWKAYGAGTLPTVGDVMLGIMYALTIPPALQGGIVANSYAIGVLGYMGIGLIPGAEDWEEDIAVAQDGLEGGALGYFVGGIPGLVYGMMFDSANPGGITDP